jgi:hypothetical protein
MKKRSASFRKIAISGYFWRKFFSVSMSQLFLELSLGAQVNCHAAEPNYSSFVVPPIQLD